MYLKITHKINTPVDFVKKERSGARVKLDLPREHVGRSKV